MRRQSVAQMCYSRHAQGRRQWAQFYDFCHKQDEGGVDAGIKGVFDSIGDVIIEMQ